MTSHIIRARYNNSAFKGIIESPSDRGQAAKAMFKTMGIKTNEILYSVSAGELVALVDGTAEQIAAMNMIVMSSGGFSQIMVEEVISTKAMANVMKNSAAKAAKYRAPNKK